ncbi:glucose 1-dehydrogenase [Aerococcaceae bacterium DSM 111022]|nr:glucose 1-dehydrogenase [Aerococcaceae bacterium DSM 111022]
MGKLDNHVALIFGGTSGLGEATAKLYAQEGAKVAIAGRNQEKAQAIIDLIEQDGGEAIFVSVDVKDSKAIQAAVEKVIEHFGDLDILYNGAGILDNYDLIEDTEEALFDEVIAVNLKAPWVAAKYALKHMAAKGSGVIINIASQATGMVGVGGTPYMSSKYGLIGQTRQLAHEYGPKGIKVNALSPGFIDTPMTEGIEDKRLLKSPLGRAGKPEEIAKASLFLASDDSDYIQGQNITQDGGWTLGGYPVD